MRRLGTLMMMAAVVVFAGLSTTDASARAVDPAATAPSGYVQEELQTALPAASFVVPGNIACPAGSVVWGGGAGDLTPTFGETLVSSFPSGGSWFAQYDNASTIARTLDVVAICAAKPARYATAFQSVDDPVGKKAAAKVTCPTGSVVLSGGAQTTADAPGSALLGAWPAGKTGFRAVNYNGTGADETVTVYAVCAKQPPKYRIVPMVLTSAASAYYTQAACPAGTSVIGGGVQIAGPHPTDVIAASEPSGATNWEGRILNPGAPSLKITTKAICAS